MEARLRLDHNPVRQELGDGLVLRTAADESDMERVAAFNGAIHGIATTIRVLAAHYRPLVRRDVVLVEDVSSGEVVSSLMLLPWTLSYCGVPLPVGEMGMVGTLEAYRGRGLVRSQVRYFMQRLRERGCLLSLIQGIPYFYRQFGYEYALPLEGGLRLSGRELPDLPGDRFSFRQAGVADEPVLRGLYDDAARELDIHTVRSWEAWQYLLAHGVETELRCETWMVEDEEGEVAGYFRLPAMHFGDELAVAEVSQLSAEAALATLHHLRQLAEARGKPGIRLNLPASCSLMCLARTLGAHDLGTYAWQVHVPDLAALLQAMGPVLERRLAASALAGLSREVRLCFYRDSVTLRFVQGRLAAVIGSGPAQGAINFPPLTFFPVLLGYRTVEELRLAYPDIRVAAEVRWLFDTLFPPLTSFVYSSY